jgi:organic hydroperoxide reductase OsmC/OhrA
MKISAKVVSGLREHEVRVCTGAATQTLAVPRKPDGPGSAVNGGEFLMLALATCYCNDLFREAQRLGIAIDAVEVEASGEFAARGLAATNITYRATVRSPGDRRGGGGAQHGALGRARAPGGGGLGGWLPMRASASSTPNSSARCARRT